MSNIKQILLNKIICDLDEKIKSFKHAICLAKESRDNETKSSVGDKYETGRTMMQFEVEKNKMQLYKIIKLKSELLKIDLAKQNKYVDFGSLVITDKSTYLVSIGLGRIQCNKKDYYCISKASPIGKTLSNKKEGDYFKFNGTEFLILKIQ